MPADPSPAPRGEPPRPLAPALSRIRVPSKGQGLEWAGAGAAPDVRPGHPRLEIVAEIARGGMGVVLQGRDNDLGRDVAVKVLRTDRRDDESLLRRFVEEAQIGGQLQHPGIVPV